jgi:hypothetical protein
MIVQEDLAGAAIGKSADRGGVPQARDFEFERLADPSVRKSLALLCRAHSSLLAGQFLAKR